MNETEIRKRHFKNTGISLRESGTGRTITGYAILFNEPSAPFMETDKEIVREIITPGAVPKSLLDKCDIKMTMFHDNKLLLARSNNGTGTLKYTVDKKGVRFEFEAPHTVDGDKAINLIKRGDLAGCSFAFLTPYYDSAFVDKSTKVINGVANITYRVKVINAIYDFTLASDPAYPATSVEARTESLKLDHSVTMIEEMRKVVNESYFKI